MTTLDLAAAFVVDHWSRNDRRQLSAGARAELVRRHLGHYPPTDTEIAQARRVIAARRAELAAEADKNLERSN